jgi:hypothetical protein
MDQNFLCNCGHSKEMHNPIKWEARKWSAHIFKQDACYAEHPSFDDILCKCREFKPDNLRYLEQLSARS